MVSKAQVMALAAGDGCLDQGANILLFGPPGGAKSHLAAALGLALVHNGRRVLFMRTTDLVQRLQVARRELRLEAAIAKLDKYQLLILDAGGYRPARAPRHDPGDERRELSPESRAQTQAWTIEPYHRATNITGRCRAHGDHRRDPSRQMPRL